MKRTVAILWASGLFFGLSGFAQDRCRELYDAAMKADTENGQRITLLRGVLKECDSFPAAFELGRALGRAGDWPGAQEAFQTAWGFAADARSKGDVLYALGKVCERTGETERAIAYFRQAVREFRHPGAEETLRKTYAERLAKGMTSAEIAGAVRKGLVVTKGPRVTPALDLMVHFQLNSHLLAPEGEAQVLALGRAMEDPSLAGCTFTLVGHTDASGNDAINDPLSLRRAQAVRERLVQEFPNLAPRVQEAAGKGSRDPLFPSGNPEDAALNRRVEVLYAGEN